MIERRAARVILVADRSVLLLSGHDPARPEDGSWWLTPGGGIAGGESPEDAAAREVLEETGFRLRPGELGPVVAKRVARFDFEGRRFRQSESFFAVTVAPFTPATSGWDDVERRSLMGHRWWRLEDLHSTDEVVYPKELAEVVDAALDGRLTEAVTLSGL